MKKYIAAALILISNIGIYNVAGADSLSAAKDILQNEISATVTNATPADKIELELAKGKLELQTATSEDIQLTSFELDEKAKRFTAFLTIAQLAPVEVSGRYIEFVEVPALKRKMSAVDVIKAEDIAYVELDARKAERGYVIDESELIGKSPARIIFANKPIIAAQIKEQTLVEEKKSVTIYFKNNLIEMQDVGIAMEDGSSGDMIRVKNANSGIVISAKVVGANLVEVAPQGAILARN